MLSNILLTDVARQYMHLRLALHLFQICADLLGPC